MNKTIEEILVPKPEVRPRDVKRRVAEQFKTEDKI